uniref:Cyclic nucleotide-binding protein n=1 Tax=Thermosporothrix sp. COM3 TaxID=2490863 RepID=A0A455SXF1_9CHLR|nr:hypothetical protein KTC_45750 [Thermosporothrix sp. COM3]
MTKTSSLPIGLAHRKDLRALTTDEIRFEIDMCIGCDRCMQACPVPLSNKMTIAELNQATIGDEIPPLVARFIHECVMCGSCVPVCPVGDHRDLLMLSLKQRLGSSWDEKADTAHILSNLPQGWNIPLLLRRLREQPALRDASAVPDNYLLHLVAASTLHVFSSDELLVQEGTFGNTLYLLLAGAVELFTHDAAGKEILLAIVRRGEYIGEQSLFSGQPRSFSVRTKRNCIMLEVPEQVIQRLMELVPAVQHYFEGLYAARLTETILLRLSLFEGVPAHEIHALATRMIIKHYERGESLFREDPDARPSRESLHILLDGFVKVSRRTMLKAAEKGAGERVIAYRQCGDYFAGGLDMLGDKQAVSVSAMTRTTAAELPRSVLLQFLRRYPEVRQRFQEQMQQYKESKVAAYSAVFEPFGSALSFAIETDKAARHGLHTLVSDGVIEGTDVLVIDLDKCIHCNECEEACARRHGHSRMNRKGKVVGNLSIASVCRQCLDPVCMLCSRAGIARSPTGEIYITESCIGCGICAERCPYHCISIVEVEEKPQQGENLWQRFSSFFLRGGKERGRRTLPVLQQRVAPGPFDVQKPRDLSEEMRKKVAVKCDLCAGYENQACIQACPTGAAIRVNPVTFFGSTEDILSRKAR